MNIKALNRLMRFGRQANAAMNTYESITNMADEYQYLKEDVLPELRQSLERDPLEDLVDALEQGDMQRFIGLMQEVEVEED